MDVTRLGDRVRVCVGMLHITMLSIALVAEGEKEAVFPTPRAIHF